MKTMKRFMALLIALIMTFALAITASAATGGTITVTGTSGTEYTVYKMFDIEIESSGYAYKVTNDWVDFVNKTNVDNYITLENDYIFWEKNTVSAADGAALAELAKAYATSSDFTGDSIGTVTATADGTGTLDISENGYYLLASNDNTASGVVAVVEGKPVSVTEKTAAEGLPRVEKKVREDSTNVLGKANTVDLGQEIEFQTTIYAAANGTNYILHDEMDEHFEFLGVTEVRRDGNQLTQDAANGYTVTTGDDTGDDCTFHLEFMPGFYTTPLHDNVPIVVTYKAKLKADKSIKTETGHENTTWLTHTEEDVPTDTDITTTETYAVTVKKVDQEGDPLAGAGFVLMDNADRYYSWDPDIGVVWVDSIRDADELVTEDPDATVTFVGVDAENLIVVETKVPGGYTGTDETDASTKDSADGTVGTNVTVEVENVLGTQLPTTGGIGTTIFYALGSVLVLGAIVLLLTKKRMAEN